MASTPMQVTLAAIKKNRLVAWVLATLRKVDAIANSSVFHRRPLQEGMLPVRPNLI